MTLKQFRKKFFMDRALAALELGQFALIVIDQDNLVA
jgi:hypothetical protein